MEILELFVPLIHNAHSPFKKIFGLFPNTQDDQVEEKLIDLLCFSMIIVGLLVFVLLFLVDACYGRYVATSSLRLSMKINANLAWFTQEVPAFAVPVVFILVDYQRNGSPYFTKSVLAGMFMFHYWYRSFVYSYLIKGGKPTPLIPWFLALAFCSVNGYIQIRSIQLQNFQSSWLSQPLVLLGITLFSAGLSINIHSDHVLRSLRKPGETGYKIPKGGLFKYVTAANYFGETLEWFGYFFAVQTMAAGAFSLFTVCNLFPRAVSHHRWYKEKFDDYPADRKIFLPFVL